MTLISTLLAPLLLAAALEGNVDFDAGVVAYRSLDYEGALAHFKAVDAATTEPGEQATLRLWSAVCQAGIGDFDAARLSMREALVIDPQVLLPTKVSPRVVGIFESEQAAAVSVPSPVPVLVPPVAAGGLDLSPLGWGGVGASAAGVVVLGGAAILGVVASTQLAVVDDPASFQDDAKAALDAANIAGGVGIAAAVVGVVLAGVGLGMVGLDLTEPPPAPPAPLPAASAAPAAASR